MKRKSHNLDERLLRRARGVLGSATETETIHEALRAVLVGDEAMKALLSVRGGRIFRREFEAEMRREISRK